jgi:alpha-beta hydrolase superfamily lysophospholipase
MVVSHGMGEHSARYLDPLRPIIENGIVAYALDHRGHGRSVQSGEALGDYGPGGFAGVVSDLVELVRLAQTENPGLPIVLFGHSMGSMIAQAFLLDNNEKIDALVLSGSAAVDVLAQAATTDPEMSAKLNQPFEPARTPFDWLSRDEAQVDAYLADPLCGFGLSVDSFVELFTQGPMLADPEQLGRIRPDLPILIVSGEDDPLNCQLHALDPLISRYRLAGLDVTTKIYAGGRHEILNETNRCEVVSDLTAWIEEAIARSRRQRSRDP